VRDAVAIVVRRDGDLVLAVKRPIEPGEDLPGVWGLPATTLLAGESAEEGVRRIGREKLGVEIEALREIGAGEQVRESYTLRMTVYEASMKGEPSLRPGQASGTRYDALDWLPPDAFADAAAKGSLCCALFLAVAPD
jgi:ADP-ribose pyrophosphatase YjhB (NUDIX family)